MFRVALPFGVEFEFRRDLCARRELENRVNAALRPFNKRCSGQETPDVWTLKEDGSCGYELTTPRLKEQEGLTEMHGVIKAIQDSFGTTDLVNRECGLHVHLDVGDLSRNQLIKVYKAFQKVEPFLLLLCPTSRRNNHYCCHINRGTGNMGQQAEDEEDAACPDPYNGAFPMEHYAAVNWGRWNQRGTIEIRYQGGTCNADRAKGWILLLQGITMHAATSGPPARVVRSLESFWNWLPRNTALNDDPVEVQWIENRWAEFNTRRRVSFREQYRRAREIRDRQMDPLHRSYHFWLRRNMNREQKRQHDATVVEYERTNNLAHPIPEEWVLDFYTRNLSRAPQGWFETYLAAHPGMEDPRPEDRRNPSNRQVQRLNQDQLRAAIQIMEAAGTDATPLRTQLQQLEEAGQDEAPRRRSGGDAPPPNQEDLSDDEDDEEEDGPEDEIEQEGSPDEAVVEELVRRVARPAPDTGPTGNQG